MTEKQKENLILIDWLIDLEIGLDLEMMDSDYISELVEIALSLQGKTIENERVEQEKSDFIRKHLKKQTSEPLP